MAVLVKTRRKIRWQRWRIYTRPKKKHKYLTLDALVNLGIVWWAVFVFGIIVVIIFTNEYHYSSLPGWHR